VTVLARLLRKRREQPTAVTVTFSGSADAAFSRAFMEMLRQGSIRIRRDDDGDPPVPV
jgi:hypothetical protein